MPRSTLKADNVVFYVVVGNGTTALTRTAPSLDNAKRIRQRWISQLSYTAPIVTVFADGAVYAPAASPGAVATTKTFLASLNKRQLARMRVTYDTASRLRAALP